MPANATPERRLVLKLFGATIVDSPANEGSNGAVRLAQEMAADDPRYTMLFQYANSGTPAPTTRGPAPRSCATCPVSTRSLRGSAPAAR